MIGIRSLSSVAIFSVLPVRSQLAIFAKSFNVSSTTVQYGEQVSYRLNITVPQGTVAGPGVVLTALSPAFSVQSIELLPTSSSIQTNGFMRSIRDNNADGVSDTAMVNFTTIVNQPDNVSTNDYIILELNGTLLANSNSGSQLKINSQLAYYLDSSLVNEEVKSVTLNILQPSLTWNVTWNATAGQAGTVLGCTVVVSNTGASASTVYNANLVATLPSSVSMIIPSVTSTYPSTVIVPSSDVIAQVVTFVAGSTATIKFSLAVNATVITSSVLSNVLTLTYASSPSDGILSYP